MKIHEYQGKAILKEFGVPVPRGIVARTPDEAEMAARELGTDVVVVKAQIHAGGRGKGGGVKLARSPEEARQIASQMLGMTLVTHQTGHEGREVKTLLIEEGLPIDREFYLGITLDRVTGRNVFMASSAGGMDIEKVAEETPELILKETIDPSVGLRGFQARKLAFSLGIPNELINHAAKFMLSLYDAYEKIDASLVEINPFLLTKDNRLIALDAKVTFDDNAMYRHKDFAELRDLDEEEPLEIEASKYDLSYIKLDGNIGCMVNGAGLAMATMDIIKLEGGEPANFLDVGGGASKEKVTAAFKIILSDPAVKGILVNIFGGIMRCDIIAEGIVAAAREVDLHVPLVVRLEGTNVQQGKDILASSGLPIIAANDLGDAAKKIVAEVKTPVAA